MKRDKVYLQHIIDSIESAIRYIGDSSYDDFRSDDKTQSAVIRQIEIIGEAANKLSEQFRNQNDSIPWSLMVSMRNKLIHDYFGVSVQLVWDTVKSDLPELRENKYLTH